MSHAVINVKFSGWFRPAFWLRFTLATTVVAGTLLGQSVPPLPALRSPVQTFRELLAAPGAQREAFLAKKSVPARELIEAKLREFEALPPGERELRLQLTQLQFYLSPLLAASAGERTQLLAGAPEDVRPMLEARLRSWDALSADARREILESEKSLSHFVRLETADPGRLADVVRQAPAATRPEVEAQLRRWLALSAAERARMTAGFQGFFGLTERERERTLKQLSSTDREQMEATLVSFGQLPAHQRQQCVEAFRKFSGLSPERRAEFLRDAAQWQSLSAAERAAWRRVVQRAVEQPPLPGEAPFRERPALVATNAP